jgi:hypothetical protein
MSRAYRIRVRESMSRVLRAHDHASTTLEILPVLPCEQMADLLRQELEGRGFAAQDGELVREQKGVRVRVDPQAGSVTVEAADSREVKLKVAREGWAFDEHGKHARETRQALGADVKKALAEKAAEHEAQLQAELADRLEAQLGDLRRELDQAVNRVTAGALKRKAAQMGQIKEVTEDPQTGSMTIVLEV